MSKKIVFDKARFRSFCREQGDALPVFYRDWWLDIVCAGGEWDVMLYVEDPNVVAFYTLYVKRKGPFRYVSMPPLTKFMGPYIVRPYSRRKKHRIISKMVESLPRSLGFDQTIHYQLKNWLPYYWKGYYQSTRYSFWIPDIRDLDSVWNGISNDYRNNKIKKAESILSVEEDLDRLELIKIFEAPFERQLTTMPIEHDMLGKLLVACARHNCGKSLYAQDDAGQVHAALYIVWDQDTTYLLLSGESPQWRSSGGGIFLNWRAIAHASSVLECSKFDFLGGMTENLERTRRQFGAELHTYHYIKKWRGLLWWLSHHRT